MNVSYLFTFFIGIMRCMFKQLYDNLNKVVENKLTCGTRPNIKLGLNFMFRCSCKMSVSKFHDELSETKNIGPNAYWCSYSFRHVLKPL